MGVLLGVGVVSGAADVGVMRRRIGFGVVERQPVLSRCQDVLDGAVAVRLQAQGPGAGGLQTVGAVLAAQTHQSQAGAVALFRMRPPLENLFNQRAGGRTGLPGPAD